ncbi:hypothetical protein LCGC14_2046070, partial [marine sediment metagenome]
EPVDDGQRKYITSRRDDREANARYSVAVYHEITDATQSEIDGGHPHDYTSNGEGGSGDRTATGLKGTNLGVANDALATAEATFKNIKPVPVYVRNSNFINLGDLLRIFYMGPGSLPLDVQLATYTTRIANGRWDATVSIPYMSWNKAGIMPPLFLTEQISPYSPACHFSEYFAVLDPTSDKVDNNRRAGPPTYNFVDEDYENVIYGRLNINTASKRALMCLPFMTNAIADQIILHRNTKMTAIPTARQGFATVGEVLVPIRKAAANNAYPPNYKLADGGSSDDGLATVNDDLAKHQIIYSRISNLITVRSDSFAAYITVMRFTKADVEDGRNSIQPNLGHVSSVQRYVAVLDRAECHRRSDWPEVLMFAEIK